MGPEPQEADADSLRNSIAAALLNGSIPADRNQWAEAYAKQSRSDLAIYELFASKEMAMSCPPIAQIEMCHSLHYLLKLMSQSRSASIHRKTAETDIQVSLSLDGKGTSDLHTGVGFLDHMLTHIAKHGLLELTVQATGDLHIDDHHTVEDVGIALGKAFAEALGDRAGITRVGNCAVPMDEALVFCAIDISGRGFLACDLTLSTPKLGDFTTELVPEFFRALAVNAGWTVHLRQMAGTNTHHIIEAAFKAFGRAMSQAVAHDPRVQGVPSTKGIL